ncbi:MAG: hypothetical protein ACD_10C00913G0001 [uncultured bacterium]|nr:MAG: hypothetical protein ACD_10C00913G0001 [uncultured bacterium]
MERSQFGADDTFGLAVQKIEKLDALGHRNGDLAQEQRLLVKHVWILCARTVVR